MPDTRNPYLDLPLDQLAAACQAAATYLGDDRPALPADAAGRMRLLLIAAGARLAPGEVWGTQPKDTRDPREFAEKLEQAHARALVLARFRALALAADHYLGAGADAWIRDAQLDGRRAYDIALESEAGLAKAISAMSTAQSGGPKAER